METAEKMLEELNAAPYNPRIQLMPGMPDYEKLRASIMTFGDVEPIVWNKRTGNVVGGHQRLSVMKDLGYEKAIVSVVDLPESEEKILNVALNKISGDWDTEKLTELLTDMDPDDAYLAGFDADELAVLLADGSDLDDFEDELDEDADYYGASWVVTLNFEDIAYAKAWAAEHGHEGAVHDGTATAVIRMDGGAQE